MSRLLRGSHFSTVCKNSRDFLSRAVVLMLLCDTLIGGTLAGCGSGTATTTPVNPTIRFAFVADSFGGLFVDGIDLGSGALTLVNNSPFGQGSSFDVVVDPSSKFVYTADCLLHSVTAFTLDSTTGALTPKNGKSTNGGNCPLALVIHPTGKFLYVLASGFWMGTEPTNPCTLNVYKIDPSTGEVIGIPGGSLVIGIGDSTGRLAMDAVGMFLYVTTGSNVLAFVIDQSTGLFTSVPGSPFAAGVGPFGLAVHPAGGCLFVANVFSGDLSTFSINSTGALTQVARTPVSQSPTTVALDPKGRFL